MSNEKYFITKENSRVLVLTLNNTKPVETYKTYEDYNKTFSTSEILSLKFSVENVINIGDIIKIEDNDFVINEIIPSEKGYYLLESEINKSAKYVLPLIADRNYATNFLFKKCLYNTYLYCDKYPQYNDDKHLFVMYKYTNNPIYKKMEESLFKNPNFIEVFEANSQNTVFIFEIPKRYIYDVSLILKGKYHMIDNFVKSDIIDFFEPFKNKDSKYKGLYTNLKEVFERNENKIKLLESKLGCKLPKTVGIESKPDINKETLKL